MFYQLFYAAVLVASIELFFIGLIMGYFQDKTRVSDLLKLGLSSIATFGFLYAGLSLGNSSVQWVGDRSSWYGATVLFLLGLKLFYDKIKLAKLKQLINPLENKGLLTLTVLVGINIFFVGLASGLLTTPIIYGLKAIIPLVLIVISGYFLGFRTKELLSRRFEFLSGMLYIALAIIIVSKF